MRICIRVLKGQGARLNDNCQGVRRRFKFTNITQTYLFSLYDMIYLFIYTVVDSDLSESSDSPGPRKYSLRQKKPTVDRFQANVEPVRRSIRALRSVLSNSMRRRKHRSKSTSSADSSDSEPQRYDKKKGKKARYSLYT